jgi:hypothetical protein
MVYGYVRVSTDSQTVENQRFEIERYCSKNNMAIDQWIEETISGTKIPEKRLLGIAACRGENRRFNRLFRIIPIGQEYIHDHVNIEPFDDKWYKNMDN